MKIKKEYFLYLLIFIGVLARFVWLDRFPPGLSHDEIEYYLNSRSYFINHEDLSGISFPKSIFYTNTEGRISPIPPVLLSLFYQVTPSTQFFIRLPYVLINIITGFVIYLITKNLFKNKDVSIIATLIYFFNPWSFFLSRWAADSGFSLLFYLSGIKFFLSAKNKKYYLFSLISFLLGFFSYHGAKIIFIPLLIFLGYYKYKFFSKTNTKLLLGVLITALIISGLYFVIDGFASESIGSERKKDLIFFDSEFLSTQVNEIRKNSIQTPFNVLFTNKASLVFDTFVRKYLAAFSAETLFISGDPRATYRFENYGLFQLYSLIFILYGALKMFKQNVRQFFMLSGILLISPLTTAVSTVDTSVVHRSFMLLFVLVIFSAYGMTMLIKKSRLAIPILGIVLLFFLRFMHFYFFQYPVMHQENTFFSETIAAEYVRRTDKDVHVVASNPRAFFAKYIVSQDKDTATEIISKKPFINETNKYSVDYITVTSDCEENHINEIIARDTNCFEEKTAQTLIQNPKDAGTIFKLTTDNLCNEFSMGKWKRFHTVQDYNLVSLENRVFCESWINIP